MNLFLSCTKKEAMFIRDLLNELLSDPELDRPKSKITLENGGSTVKVTRTFETEEREEET